MKLVVCYLAPSKAPGVKKGLWDAGFRAFSLSQAEGVGMRRGSLEGGVDHVAAVTPKVRLEVACRDSEAEAVVAAVVGEARTGRVGDGKILILDLPDAVRVRTGERGEAAL